MTPFQNLLHHKKDRTGESLSLRYRWTPKPTAPSASAITSSSSVAICTSPADRHLEPRHRGGIRSPSSSTSSVTIRPTWRSATRQSRVLLRRVRGCDGDSIFSKTTSSTPEWSQRFEHGFSQIVDWVLWLDNQRGMAAYTSRFGTSPIEFAALLVIGRDRYL